MAIVQILNVEPKAMVVPIYEEYSGSEGQCLVSVQPMCAWRPVSNNIENATKLDVFVVENPSVVDIFINNWRVHRAAAKDALLDSLPFGCQWLCLLATAETSGTALRSIVQLYLLRTTC